MITAIISILRITFSQENYLIDYSIECDEQKLKGKTKPTHERMVIRKEPIMSTLCLRKITVPFQYSYQLNK